MTGNTFYFNWEVSLMEFLQGFIGPFGISLAKAFTFLGSSVALIAVVGTCYLGINKKIGLKIGINTLVGAVSNCMIKNIFNRRRPYFDNSGIKCLVPVDSKYDIYDLAAQGWSFPSGHSGNAAAICASIASAVKKKYAYIIAAIATFGVGFSRVIVGCHYPTDVICGWVQGLLTVLIVQALYDKIDKKKLYLILVCFLSIGFAYCKSNDFYQTYGITIGFLASNLFDEKYVDFKNTKNFIKMLVRVAFSAGVFFGCSSLLKMPFSSELLNSTTMTAYLIRAIRYAISTFVGFGLCPMLYKYNILKLDDEKRWL